MTLSCSNNCLNNEVEPKACDTAQSSWESPILNGEQPEAVEDSEFALNEPGCVTRAHPTTRSGLSKLTLFVLASAHT